MEMMQHHQVINYGRGGGGGRRGKDEWAGKGGGDRGKESRDTREKFDQNKVVGILARRKEKTGTQVSLTGAPYCAMLVLGRWVGGPAIPNHMQPLPFLLRRHLSVPALPSDLARAGNRKEQLRWPPQLSISRASR